MNIEWKEIEDYDYFINELGEIKNKRGNLVKSFVNSSKSYPNDKRLRVSLWKNGISTKFYINVLVDKYFPKQEGKNL